MAIYKPPVVTILNDHDFELVEPFVFGWEEVTALPLASRQWRITIPAGFSFDGASVPRVCWTLTGLLPSGVHLGAAAVHDYAYERRGRIIRGEVACLMEGVWQPQGVVWDRGQCDEMFLRIMRDAGETSWKSRVMFAAVRAFGGVAWNR